LPHGGAIQISLKANSEIESANRAIEVRVHDSGKGIAPAIRARLFEPFVSSKETGLGLGLSICKRLVEAHGGTIGGDNAREGGAVFSFSLPTHNGKQLTENGSLHHADAPGRR
jgi:signal transduction histidine kinase